MTPDFEISPFTADHLDAAAALLAERQVRLRAIRPELPAAFMEADRCRPLLSGLLDRDEAHGVVATREQGMAGFLIGYPRYEPIWGRACWSPIEGQAHDPLLGPDLMRDLYAAWSRHFVDDGFFRQYVHAPADDPALLDTWFLTGFGKMQAHALRDLNLEPPADPPFITRRATPGDLDRIGPLMDLIATQLVRSPAYAIALPEVLATYRAEYASDLKDPAAYYWLAEENGAAIGLQGLYKAEPGPMVPDGAWELADAKTAPEARGHGVARALLAAAFAEARSAGASHCVTDWRTASLASHRSWMAIGFKPTHFRLHRHIDERIAWAGGPPG
ncbi:MAG: GNAT family N-acetyltransferase [Chloroflexota bacterium]|nr:GNAT family N-acetyltransferase [Chloroflexota bacterium]